jgi:hypothetical protein
MTLCELCTCKLTTTKTTKNIDSDQETVFSDDDENTIWNFQPKNYHNMKDMKDALTNILKTSSLESLLSHNIDGITKFHYVCRLIAIHSSNPNNCHRTTSALNFFFSLKEMLPSYYPNENIFYRVMTHGTSVNKGWTVLHDFFSRCNIFDKKTVRIFTSLLLKSGLSIDMKDDNGITPRKIRDEKMIEKNVSDEIKINTTMYKELEDEFKTIIIKEYNDKLCFCSNCNRLISYLSDLKNIINFHETNPTIKAEFLSSHKDIICDIIKYRKLCVKIFEGHNSKEVQKMKNNIDKHKYVVNLYQQFF